MWLSFWRSKNRFTFDELRYVTDQLMKVQVVNEVNKDFVIEALRSIAELITYGDQHDPNFFDFFMEKQVMGEFVRILKISRTVIISLQLLQTISIMMQNLKSEQSIYYLFSNEHINYLITYSFDFRNEELLSYYISFLRAIGGKLNKNTISLLVKTQNTGVRAAYASLDVVDRAVLFDNQDEVVAFPLYVEGIRFAFHEESMVRTAVRALTLNVYHVGDVFVNQYIASDPHSEYFINLVEFFRQQCKGLNALVTKSSVNRGSESTSTILSLVDEIEDNLYYFSDVISAGIPDVGRLITDNMLKLLVIPLLLPSLRTEAGDGVKMDAATSLYLLCCILRIVKIKDLANIVAAALFCSIEAFVPSSEIKRNGFKPSHDLTNESKLANDNLSTELDSGGLNVSIPSLSSSSEVQTDLDVLQHNCKDSSLVLRDVLLSYITIGNDVQVMGSLSMLATLLQTKELDESMLDALGILPQRKQHKKLLLQALVGESLGEEQLFSSESSTGKDGSGSDLNSYLQRLKDEYAVSCSCPEVGKSPRLHRHLVLDALVCLLCRPNISAETLWDGGWLLRQLLPYSEAEFNSYHLQILKESYKNCCNHLLEEVRGSWPDLLITVLCDEWRKCKRAIEASSPRKEPKCIIFPSHKSSSADVALTESSLAAGERMYELVKVFVLLHQLQIFSLGRALPDQPSVLPPADIPEKSRAKTAGLDIVGPKPSTELNLVDAVPCRIAFERGKERHFCFLAISKGSSGWLVLAEELPLKPHYGIIRVAAPLAGCKPRIDEKHSRWLHLRIRPSSFPFMDSAEQGKVKTKSLVDGRWTLAFKDEESCKSAFSMILDEINLQSDEVERRLRPVLDLERAIDRSNLSQPLNSSSSGSTPSNSL